MDFFTPSLAYQLEKEGHDVRLTMLDTGLIGPDNQNPLSGNNLIPHEENALLVLEQLQLSDPLNIEQVEHYPAIIELNQKLNNTSIMKHFMSVYRIQSEMGASYQAKVHLKSSIHFIYCKETFPTTAELSSVVLNLKKHCEGNVYTLSTDGGHVSMLTHQYASTLAQKLKTIYSTEQKVKEAHKELEY